MKRHYCFILMLVCFPFLLGMGSQGGTPADIIPVPEKKFTATFVDQMDVLTQCSDVSIEGGTALQGKIGEGTYTVAFENIKEVVFRLHEERLHGQVRLPDGSSIELVVGKDKKAYGRTKFGTFQIVQTFTRFTAFDFSSTQRTFCRLGNQTFLVLLLAWLTLLPVTGFLPHTSHTLDMRQLLNNDCVGF
jgi:hypothetical protein